MSIEPTTEWQVVPEGFAVPKGCHCRANLQTGQVMVKLVEPDSSDANSLELQTSSTSFSSTSSSSSSPPPSERSTSSSSSSSSPPPPPPPSERERLLPTSIAGILKWSTNFHDTRMKPSDFGPMDPERRKWLKNVMESMTVNVAKRVETLVETICKGLEVERGDGTAEDLVPALEELVDLVEDLDNARDLHLVGGFAPVVSGLASPVPSTRALVSEVIATVVQNNPETQGFADELDVMPALMKIIEDDANEESMTKALRALSAMFRGNRPLTDKFFSLGGLQLFEQCFQTCPQKAATKILFTLSQVVGSYPALLSEHPMDKMAGLAIKRMALLTAASGDLYEQAVGFLRAFSGAAPIGTLRTSHAADLEKLKSLCLRPEAAGCGDAALLKDFF